MVGVGGASSWQLLGVGQLVDIAWFFVSSGLVRSPVLIIFAPSSYFIFVVFQYSTVYVRSCCIVGQYFDM